MRSFTDYPESLFYGAPIKIYWQGFESDTRTLGSRGWKIMAHQDIMCDQMQIAIHNPKSGIYGVTRMERFEYERMWRTGQFPVFNIPFEVGQRVELRHSNEFVPPVFREVDPFPAQIRPDRITKMEDLFHFAEKKVEQIFVEKDPSVDDLLGQIIAKQAEAKHEYYAEKVRAGKLVPATTAEIIQFSKAA